MYAYSFHTAVWWSDENFELQACSPPVLSDGGGDIVVFSARSELEAQGKGSEELELLWELERPVRGVRPVAFPALEALRGVVARAVAIVVDHVEDIALRSLLRHCVFIVRTVDIQVVVYAHVDVVVTTKELCVGPVPEDGVAVGHHFGTGLLA